MLIQSDLTRAAYLVALIEEDNHLELMAPAPLSIVCFRYHPHEISESKLNKLNDNIINEVESDGRIFLTGTKINGHTALRVCFINHRTTYSDVDLIVSVIKEIGHHQK